EADAGAFLEGGNEQRQRRQPARFEGRDQGLERGGAGAFQRGAIEQDRDGRLRRRTPTPAPPPSPPPQGGGGRQGDAGGRVPVAEAGERLWGEVAKNPLPNPPHKGEGVGQRMGHGRASNTGRHLPSCGGG